MDVVINPHGADPNIHYYRQATAPTANDGLIVGDIWSDTTANLIKRCTQVTPSVQFVSIEAGGITLPGSSTDNAIVRWHETGGDALQDSGVIIDDSDNITGVASVDIGTLFLQDPTELTISGGAVTVTQSHHKIDTQDDDPTDDLTDIAGGAEGHHLILRAANNARIVVVKHNSGAGVNNLVLQGEADFSIDSTRDIMGLFHRGGSWVEIWRSNNNAATNDATHVHKKYFIIKIIANDTTLTTGDNLNNNRFVLPDDFAGMNLIEINAHVFTVSSSGLPTFVLQNVTQTADVTSTGVTIDANEKDSNTATTDVTIDTGEDDYTAGDELQIDCDVAGTGTKGAEIRLTYRTP